MESMQQRCCHKLYGVQAMLLARIASLEADPRRTPFASDELYRCIGAKEHVRDALDLLLGDPEVDPLFQIELPF